MVGRATQTASCVSQGDLSCEDRRLTMRDGNRCDGGGVLGVRRFGRRCWNGWTGSWGSTMPASCGGRAPRCGRSGSLPRSCDGTVGAEADLVARPKGDLVKKNLPPRHTENCREPKRLAARIPRRRSQHARGEAGQRREDQSARAGRPACGAPKDKAVTKSIAAILVVLGLASTAALPATGEAPPRRPNILFILVDDYGIKDVGVEGSTLLRDAEHRRPGARRHALHARLRRLPGVQPVAREHLAGQASRAARHHRLHRRRRGRGLRQTAPHETAAR